uniref:Uncharacterized protein n=1 Tax=Tanacetum cinerariifolium TaxID=118510 RepID=A0A6L2JBY3_TANCI|nr:hypothetical protein [Tanacetum cinerariifolium]
MSSIIAQQAKLDLELVPKEKRLEIRKCNGILNLGKIQREPTFQVVLDALALTPCYSAFLVTTDVPIDIFKICPRVQGQDFDVLSTDDEIVPFLRELRHTREINSLNDVVVDHMHQPWRTFYDLINKSLSGKTTGLDKLCLFRAQTPSGESSPKLTTVPVSTEAPTRKSKRVKRPAKKSTETPASGVVIRETPEMPLSKKKEKVDVTRGKGIKLLSQVALTEDAQFEEVRKKNMRDFHKTRPSGSGTVTKTALSVTKIKPSTTSEGTGIKPEVPDVAEEESSESKAESWENDEDDSNDEQANEPVDTNEGFVQEEDTDAVMTNVQQGNENLEILQVIEDADVTLSTVPQETEVPVTSSSHSFDLAAKFLNFLNIPHSDAKIVSPIDVYIQHEVPSQQTPTLLTVPVSVISDSSQVFSTVSHNLYHPLLLHHNNQHPHHHHQLKLQILHLHFLISHQFSNSTTESQHWKKKLLSSKMILSTLNESYLAAPEQKECYEGLKKSYDLEKTIFSTYGKVYSLKRSRKDKDEDPFAGSDRGLKKRKTSKDAEPAKSPKAKESQSSSSKGDKSKLESSRKSVQSEELEFKVADSDMPHDQEENLGNDDEEPKEKVASKRDWFIKPTQPQGLPNPD